MVVVVGVTEADGWAPQIVKALLRMDDPTTTWDCQDVLGEASKMP